ncbi:hypothetical protein NBRC116584_02480 [Hydrogenophaga sp. 5NK40-0174]
MHALDEMVKARQAGDAQDQPVDGFVYARTSRFLSSWREELDTDDPSFRVWAAMLADRGREGLEAEWSRLSLADRHELLSLGRDAQAPDERGAERIERCSRELLAADLARPEARQAMLENSAAKDAYVDWQRWLGAYPLSRVPFSAGVRRWQEETQRTFDVAQDGTDSMPEGLTRYVPVGQPAGAGLSGRQARASSPWPRNALGVPILDAGDLSDLFTRHAPVLRMDVSTDDDRPGTMRVSPEGELLVDVMQPVAYIRASFTRWGGQVMLQLNYLFWFSSRPATSSLDLLAGRFDGFIWRVTLDESGLPLVYDTIHACGCYHEFFPVRGVLPRPVPEGERGNEWLFMPGEAPVLQEGQRMALHLASGSHYLTRVAVADISEAGDVGGVRYGLIDENGLRALPVPAPSGESSGRTASAYAPDGLVPGSERLERFLFWPMGIPSAGAQRQWGHHATAFVGRRHFDDPYLMESRFELPRPGTAEKKATPAKHGHGL